MENVQRVSGALVACVNAWWREYLQNEYGLTSALELQYETHYRRAFHAHYPWH